MFSTAIASGHLTKLKNMAIPDEFLADIFLTETGSELGQTVFDRKFCEMAVAEARKSIPENDGDCTRMSGRLSLKRAMLSRQDFEAKRVKEDTQNIVLSERSTTMSIMLI